MLLRRMTTMVTMRAGGPTISMSAETIRTRHPMRARTRTPALLQASTGRLSTGAVTGVHRAGSSSTCMSTST